MDFNFFGQTFARNFSRPFPAQSEVSCSLCSILASIGLQGLKIQLSEMGKVVFEWPYGLWVLYIMYIVYHCSGHDPFLIGPFKTGVLSLVVFT